MALRTNSKKVRANIKQYILDHFDPCNYDELRDMDTSDFKAVCTVIAETFYDEELKHDNRWEKGRITHYQAFEEWCAGLPSLLDTCYYYNRSAVTDLGDILEETEAERNKFTESEAESLLTRLIYREVFA